MPMGNERFMDYPSKPTRAVLLSYDETQLALEHLSIRKDQLLEHMVILAKEGLANDILELSKTISKIDDLVKKLKG